MPTRAPRRCTASGCEYMARPGSGRCERHHIERPRPKAKPRPSSTAQGYDAAWAALSARYRRAHPICQALRCTAPSRHTDHIDGDRTNSEWSNLQALCIPHHSRKTALHDGGFGNTRTPRG